jgi:Carboxypeptidase regulatory-like domain/TonB dependent receptor/TonB-dependent Receptor Plug Domain
MFAFYWEEFRYFAPLNQNYMLKKIVGFFTFMLALVLASFAQNTTSSISGVIKTSKGDPLLGATVTATHIPTGTVYRVATRTGGRFTLYNMNPGGPYTITVSFVGFTDEKKEDVFLNLGEPSTFDFILNDKSSTLTEVVVAGRRTAPSSKGGTETSIGRDKLANLPSVGRNLSDFLRAVPQAKLTATDGGISIAGQNNRFNSFYVDGAINNDVFGLSASGTNGGQTSAPPISIDAIDQFQVIISPYDASIGNFTGGGINAITRSGSNEVQGSLWHYRRNEKISGRNPTPTIKPGTFNVYERTQLAKFTNQTTGFRIGGPIIKNKLFFFILGELQRDERPQPYQGDYRGTTNTAAGIEAVANFVRNTYKYDPGGYLDNPDKIEADRITAKLDWNINDKNKLSFSYRYNKALRNNVNGSTTNRINFFNNGFVFPSTTNSASLELKSNFNQGANNRLLLTVTNVEDDRGPLGGAFPNITINDGAGTYVIGTEFSSTQNFLQQKNFALLNTYRFLAGKNTISIGTDNEMNTAYNVFIQGSFGAYTYNSVSDFLANARPARYQRNFALLDGSVSDNTLSAAQFRTLRVGFFVNDEIRVNDQLTINLGVRADKTEFLTKPVTDPFFNDTALAVLSQFYDLKGARSGQVSRIPWSVSPRIGFTYKMDDEGITVRGGAGLFTGRIPLVWPGGIYNNNGISVGGVNIANPNITFRADPNNQYTTAELGVGTPTLNAKGSMNLIAKTFRLPKIFRASFAVDKRLGQGWTTTFEAIFTKNINEITYENVNIAPARFAMAGPDKRVIYDTTALGPTKINIRPSGVRNPYDNVLVLSNVEGKRRGFSYSLTAILDKAFRNGFAFTTSYSFGNSMVYNEATSSVNTSQWRFIETVNGRNSLNLTTSDFDMGHRIFSTISKRFQYAKKSLATTITLAYNGQSGAPFSYVYTNSPVNDDGRVGNNQNNDLIYVPTAAEVQAMVFDANTVNGVTYNQQQQRDLFEAYIQTDKYLLKTRGKYAERNGSRLPFTHLLDFKLAQDFSVRMNGRKYSLQLAWEVSNFTNMLNRDWGKTYFLLNDNFRLLNFRGFVSTNPAAPNLTPRYQFSPVIGNGKPYGLNTITAPAYAARWLSQVSVRLNF